MVLFAWRVYVKPRPGSIDFLRSDFSQKFTERSRIPQHIFCHIQYATYLIERWVEFFEMLEKDWMWWRKIFTTRLFYRWFSVPCRRLQTRYVGWSQSGWPKGPSSFDPYFSPNAILYRDRESDFQTDKSSLYS